MNDKPNVLVPLADNVGLWNISYNSPNFFWPSLWLNAQLLQLILRCREAAAYLLGRTL